MDFCNNVYGAGNVIREENYTFRTFEHMILTKRPLEDVGHIMSDLIKRFGDS